MKYRLMVAENSHYMDESEQYPGGEFKTVEEAIRAARQMVDDDLASLYKPGMAADDLYRYYTTFGTDPYILSSDENCSFSAWTYARQRSQEICAPGVDPNEGSP